METFIVATTIGLFIGILWSIKQTVLTINEDLRQYLPEITIGFVVLVGGLSLVIKECLYPFAEFKIWAIPVMWVFSTISYRLFKRLF